jgi:hypothetical protein
LEVFEGEIGNERVQCPRPGIRYIEQASEVRIPIPSPRVLREDNG